MLQSRMGRLIFSLLLSWACFAAAPPNGDDAAVLSKLRAQLRGKREVLQREVRRLGGGEIELEVFAESEMDPVLARGILRDVPRYGSWMLRDINQSPDGSRYLCQLHSLKASPNAANLLVALYSLDIPLLHTQRQVIFEVRDQSTLNSFTLFAQSDDPPGALATADGLLKIFPSESNARRSWIYARGRVHVKNWLLYEALPEKVLSHETAERLRVLLDNYLRQESTVSAGNPKRK